MGIWKYRRADSNTSILVKNQTMLGLVSSVERSLSRHAQEIIGTIVDLQDFHHFQVSSIGKKKNQDGTMNSSGCQNKGSKRY